MGTTKLGDIELDLLIRALQQRHGYDFSQYARASFKRRVQALVDHFGLANVSQLTERVLHRDECIPDVIARLRSEEHTSELQSLMRISYAVFCLKKKKKNKQLI